jgi:DNA-directed RNA polymerase III subunit RPC1
MKQRTASRNGRALYPYEVKRLAQAIYPESVPIVEVDTKPVVTKGRKKPVKVAPPPPAQQPIEMLEGWSALHSKFREDTYNFIETKIVKAMADQRLRRGLPPAEDAQDAENYSLDASDRTYLSFPGNAIANLQLLFNRSSRTQTR